MADRLKRREFIKNVSLAGASIAITDVAAANSNNGDEIKNEWFTVSFDRHKGTFSIYRNNGNALLTGGTVCINTGNDKLSVASDRYKHTVASTIFNDQAGLGKRLMVFSKDKNKKANLEIWVSLYDQ